MAKQIIYNPVIIISGGTVSANVHKATLTTSVATVDATAFDTNGWESPLGGMKSGTLALEFHNDYAAGAIDSIVWPLLGGTASFEVRPASTAAAGSSNPKYTGTILVTEYSPMDAAVADLAAFSVTWPTVGIVTRGTA